MVRVWWRLWRLKRENRLGLVVFWLICGLKPNGNVEELLKEVKSVKFKS